MTTKEVLEDLIKQMEHMRSNKTVPYLNPYKGIDDCVDLIYRRLKTIKE